MIYDLTFVLQLIVVILINTICSKLLRDDDPPQCNKFSNYIPQLYLYTVYINIMIHQA